ncbi:MAG: putative zinc-binding metallopeptidase [Candidatus Omnitrophota bacterium]
MKTISKKITNLEELSSGELLKLRISDLPLSIKGTWIEECIAELYKELEEKGISFRPEFYLADEWLTPDKEPVIGIPFFLAHPVLLKLEKKMMLEAEGAGKEWCMKLLRHETGHAINYAYRLYRLNKWRELFGPFSSEYEDTYRFRPYSKSFVRHLEKHYAQCHPDEDFAETFAVWLTPGLNWHEKYKTWKALEKLLYVDKLMEKIGQRKPQVAKGKKHWCLSRLRISLKNYYRKKQDLWAEEFPDFYDEYLNKVFYEQTRETKDLLLVFDVLKKFRKNILNNVARCTGERKFIISDLLKVIMSRCNKRRFCTAEGEADVVLRITAYITTLVMNYLYTGKFKGEK